MFLCRLKTLRDWKAAVFYEANEMMFDDIKKKVYMEVLTGGHHLFRLEPPGDWS